MVKDNELSDKRSQSGRIGADKTNKHFAAAKPSATNSANTGYGYGNGLDYETIKKRYENFKFQCLSHQRWQEDLCYACKLEVKDIPEILNQYVAHIGAGDIVHDTLGEFKTHVRNWLLKRGESKNGNTPRTPKILD